MFQVETMPQSIVDMKILVLKPRLDQGDIQLIGEKIKPRLFSNFGFKPKSEDIKLLGSEIYFEPYLIIGGKYVLDYCRKHVFKVNVTEKTTKVFIAGQEFKSEQSDLKKTAKTITMIGQESAHHERQAYFILDRMKREISPDRLPISPFDIQKENIRHSSCFKSMPISDEAQMEFLKTKIATRPADVTEIMREVFDITDRTIAYYPMYQLTFENSRNQKDAIVIINGITGEIILNGIKRLAVKTIVASPKSNDAMPLSVTTCQTAKTQTVMKVSNNNEVEKTSIVSEQKETTLPTKPMQTDELKAVVHAQTILSDSHDTKDETKKSPERYETNQPTPPNSNITLTLGFPAKISGEIFTVGDNVTAIVGDLEIPSDTKIDKTLVVKGTLRIGDNCRVHGKLKAMKDVTVGSGTIIDGDLISGGNVSIGPNVLISGSLQANGYIKIGEQAAIEHGICSSSNLEIVTAFEQEANFEKAVASVEWEK